MLSVMRALAPAVRASLSGIEETDVSLFTRRHGDGSMEKARAEKTLKYPYGLLLPVGMPKPDKEWDMLVGFSLDFWGPLWAMHEIQGALAWMDGFLLGDFEDAQGIWLYRYGNAAIIEEPEVRMPDGSDLYHYRDPYRASYGDKRRLDAMQGVTP